MKGVWYKYQTPLSLRDELLVLKIMGDSKTVVDAATPVASLVLDLPPPLIEEYFSGPQIFGIFESVVPKMNSSSSPKPQIDQLDLNEMSLEESVRVMVAFLSYYAHIQPSETLRLPRAMVEDLMKESSKLLEADKRYLFDLSAVNALNMAFGGGSTSGSSGFSSERAAQGDIDLTNIDEIDDSNLRFLNQQKGLGVEVR